MLRHLERDAPLRQLALEVLVPVDVQLGSTNGPKSSSTASLTPLASVTRRATLPGVSVIEPTLTL